MGLVGIATLLIGIGASAAIWGVPKFLKRKTSIKGQVNSYLLDDRGTVNGLLLSTGDQLHFNPETGVAVAAQIKIGDEVTAIGHAGTQSKYGGSHNTRTDSGDLQGNGLSSNSSG